MADYKSSTLGESMKPIEVEATQTVAETPTIPTETPIENSNISVSSNGELETQVAAPAEAVVETPQETNVSDFVMPDEPTTEAVAQEDSNWKEALKKADKKTILKELGVSDFAIEMDEHLSKGGEASKYLEAKAIDYNKISDAYLAKEALRGKYGFLDDEKFEKLFASRYNQTEFADDEAKELGSIQMQADAHEYRQKKIQEQQAFKMPDNNAVSQQITEQQKIEQQRQAQQVRDFYFSHNATQNLMTSKRVAVKLGEGDSFNFNVDKPEVLTSKIMDSAAWQKATTNEKGEPDVAKLQRLYLAAMNPNYELDIFNYGKSKGHLKEVREGQNASKPVGTMPQATTTTERDAWKSAQSGTLGGGRSN